jgi:autoinducer 2 (AI-2) kinase
MGMAYEEFQGSELWGKKVGLVGVGMIGRKVAQRLLPFGAHILAYDPYLSAEDATLAGVDLVSLDTLLAESDFVSLHAPVTQTTRGMIGATQLNKMKSGAYIINTARAAILDESALYEALAERLLKGQQPRHVLNPETLHNFSWTAERKSLSQSEIKALLKKSTPGVSDLEMESRGSDEDQDQPQEKETVVTPPSSSRRGGILSRVRDLMSASEKDIVQMTQNTDNSQVATNMQHILSTFLENAVTDQALQKFSKDKDFTMHFLLTDLKQEFYLRFANGSVTGDLAAPGSSPDLTLKMKADILDGMFTGRINPTRAAMTGKISFSGDTRRAMTMQKIQKDLSRLYTLAREAVGDPGDLTAISTEGKPAGAAAAPPPVQTVTVDTPVLVGDERDEIIPVLNELYTSGLITATGGNISLRTSKYPDQAWITPSQIFKGDLRADMMVRIDMNGAQLDDDALPASSERLVHCAIYRRRPDLNAIVHTHAPNTTILMLAGQSFVPISTEAAFVGDIPVIPFIMPGTNELGEAVAETIGGGVAVFMQNHGLVVGGSSLRRAADVTEIIEATSEKLIMLHLLGVRPPTLPDDILEELSELRDLMA